MADTEQEAQWRNEFEMLGYDEVRTHAYNGDYPQGHLKRQVALRLSLLKNLSSLGIGLPTKIGRIEHWPLLRSRQHAWVLGAIRDYAGHLVAASPKAN